MFSFLHMLRLPQPEAEVYCREKRFQRFERFGARVRHLPLHSTVHPFLVGLLRLERISHRGKLMVLADRRQKTRRPVIFACTHVGGADIERAFEVVRTPCWLALGDPRESYKNFAGFMLQMNGVIPFDTRHTRDRRIAKAQMAELLRRGGNLLIFPEGSWNISPNRLVMPLYAGTAQLALETGAEIVPVALHREGADFYARIGENLRPGAEDRIALTDRLRDALAALVWETMAHFPTEHRADLPEDYHHTVFMREIHDLLAAEPSTFTLEDVLETLFRPKCQTDPEEAFRFMASLCPHRENAFLFNHRWSGTPAPLKF